jgi:hypothetical protein
LNAEDTTSTSERDLAMWPITEEEWLAIPPELKFEDDGRLWVKTPHGGTLVPIPVQIVASCPHDVHAADFTR